MAPQKGVFSGSTSFNISCGLQLNQASNQAIKAIEFGWDLIAVELNLIVVQALHNTDSLPLQSTTLTEGYFSECSSICNSVIILHTMHSVVALDWDWEKISRG